MTLQANVFYAPLPGPPGADGTGSGGAVLTAMQLATLASVAGKADQSAVDEINAALQTSDLDLDTLPERVAKINELMAGLDSLAISDVEGLQDALNASASGGGGIVQTVSGGATITHDGAGATPPTYTDNGSGSGTLASNGNNVTSVTGEFAAINGAYTFNHTQGPVLGAAYLVGPNSSQAPNSAGASITDTTHEWAGLIGSNNHAFVWTF